MLNEVAQLKQRRDTVLKSIDEEAIARHEQADIEYTRHLRRLDRKIKSKKVDIVELSIVLNGLKEQQLSLENDIDALTSQKVELQGHIEQGNEELRLKTEDFKALGTEVDRLAKERNDLESTNSELGNNKLNLQADIEVLTEEIDAIEAKIIEDDAQFKIQFEQNQNNLKQIATKLQMAYNKLIETQNKDKSIRESWAIQALALDKREKVVRKREIKAEGLEGKVQDYNDFMKL